MIEPVVNNGGYLTHLLGIGGLTLDYRGYYHYLIARIAELIRLRLIFVGPALIGFAEELPYNAVRVAVLIEFIGLGVEITLESKGPA